MINSEGDPKINLIILSLALALVFDMGYWQKNGGN